MEIPTGFDFSTHHEVTINIIDNLNYAKYDVYAYSEELYDAGTETFENESGETVTETVYKSDVLDKLIFSGVPRNGVLKQTINLPKFYNKVYIRRSEQQGFSSSIKDIVNQEVNYNYSSNKVSTKSTFKNQVNDYLYCVNGSAESASSMRSQRILLVRVAPTISASAGIFRPHAASVICMFD